MKNTKNTRTARPRHQRTHALNTTERFQPKATEKNPPTKADRLTPIARPTDFLSLCFYPGMGEHHTAA